MITELVMWCVVQEYKVLWECNVRESYLIWVGETVKEDLIEEMRFEVRPQGGKKRFR